MTRSACQHKRLIARLWILQVIAYLSERISLPLTWAGSMCQFSPLFPPRERIEGIAKRIVSEPCNILDQLLFRR